MIKVGINGFGRIGRFVFRAAQKRSDIQIVGINDLCPVDYLAYMLKYDTMHGQFDGTIEADVENSKLIVNGQALLTDFSCRVICPQKFSVSPDHSQRRPQVVGKCRIQASLFFHQVPCGLVIINQPAPHGIKRAAQLTHFVQCSVSTVKVQLSPA